MKKKLILVALVITAVGFVGCAKEAEARCGRRFKNYVNEEAKPRMEAGIGGDVSCGITKTLSSIKKQRLISIVVMEHGKKVTSEHTQF